MLFPIKDYNPTRRLAIVTIIIISINIGVFLFQAMISSKPLGYHVASYAMVPMEITHLENIDIPIKKDEFGNIYTMRRGISPFMSLISSMFMHGSWMHLLGNMLFLWIFGNNIEDYLGKFKFILFYLVCGIGASFSHILFNWNSMVPVLGASGAVSGIMGAYLVLFPNARVRTLVFILFFITFVDIPAFVFLLVWFAFQFLSVGIGIAWLAHVGGFVIGYLFIRLYRSRRKPLIEIVQ